MKKGIHLTHTAVAFRDSQTVRRLLQSKFSRERLLLWTMARITADKARDSNTSHPYTGKMKLVDTAGRVDKFMNRNTKHYDKQKASE